MVWVYKNQNLPDLEFEWRLSWEIQTHIVSGFYDMPRAEIQLAWFGPGFAFVACRPRRLCAAYHSIWQADPCVPNQKNIEPTLTPDPGEVGPPNELGPLPLFPAQTCHLGSPISVFHKFPDLIYGQPKNNPVGLLLWATPTSFFLTWLFCGSTSIWPRPSPPKTYFGSFFLFLGTESR